MNIDLTILEDIKMKALWFVIALAWFVFAAICSLSFGFDCYIDEAFGDDAGEGSEASPWQTITHALESVEGTEAEPVTIHVAAGTPDTGTVDMGFHYPIEWGSSEPELDL